MQSRNRDADVENKHGNQGRREGWDELGEWDGHVYTIGINR